MPRIVMLSSFETGHPGIDTDHRLIIERVNGIYDAIAAGDIARGRDQFDSFTDFCADHFAREEGYLAGLGFPRTAEHAAYHKELMGRAEVIRGGCVDIFEPGMLERCFDDLAIFLIDDIVRGDSDFVSYLGEVGMGKKR